MNDATNETDIAAVDGLQPNTDEMVTFLYDQLRMHIDCCRQFTAFAIGDIMSAAMHIAIDVALESGAEPPQLQEDMAKIAREMIAASRGTLQ